MPSAQTDAATSERQKHVFVDAMRPQRTDRPTIAVVALNEGTETTDFLLTHAVLKRSNLANVQAVAPRSGHVSLYPVLAVDGAQDFASFDQAHPSGADYVIVPALADDDDPAIISWLKTQADRGARIVGVCAGAVVVANAGLLDGRRFTTHWYYRARLLKHHPTAVHVPNQRYVVDGNIATTTGITASVPTMLALVEAIGGLEKARALADELGVSSWTPAHDSSPFHLTAGRRWHYVLNKIAFWRHEEWSVDVQEGVDDVTVAFVSDAWSRTGRISIEPSAPGPVRMRSGLTLTAQPMARDVPRVPLTRGLKPVEQLNRTLREIEERFGVERREWVMMEMEYPGAEWAS